MCSEEPAELGPSHVGKNGVDGCIEKILVNCFASVELLLKRALSLGRDVDRMRGVRGEEGVVDIFRGSFIGRASEIGNGFEELEGLGRHHRLQMGVKECSEGPRSKYASQRIPCLGRRLEGIVDVRYDDGMPPRGALVPGT